MIVTNLLRQIHDFKMTHIGAPRYLVIEPETFEALCKELSVSMDEILRHNFRMYETSFEKHDKKCLIYDLEVVVVPIPELFYIAGSPLCEVNKAALRRQQR